ncbi:signal peptide peptidase SppA, 36K type [Solidesulfovibrio fructosivorans JJ]]|uniref:Signal peptide peptidase SppA, 36K type n=1 Tax=Solidesulfovibrio fructosivorans JJ] TaxID=596151 RepID=E1JRX4_SOLFR|nr:signal peptide peptidase SppA [Solidesulfovibrio fructosivorans]EFL52743.1 signal peptide peptidase SppA, 36K type [Solidesulfovibrio fructosivorans JJ]]
MPSANQSFASRRPGLFGLVIAVAAVILVLGIAAACGVFGHDEEGGSLLGAAEPRIGVVRIEGPIVAAEDVVAFIRKLREDKSVKGVVLRVNSPGGAFGPSQEMYMAVKKLRAVKPVVASFSAVAASGGYYAACPAGRIFANPGTITGSIGVMTQFANVRDLLQKLGIDFESLTTGKLKDAGSPFKPLTDDQRAYLKGLIDDLNKQFSGDVAKQRKLAKDAIAAIADGRAMTGARALELGLVDELGGQEEAVDYLKKETGLTGDVPLLKGPKKKTSLLEKLSSSLSLPDLRGMALVTVLSELANVQSLPQGR